MKCGLALSALAAAAVMLAAQDHLRLNVSASMPLGFWWVDTTPSFRTGDAVTVCLPDAVATMARSRGYVGSGTCSGDAEPLLKTVLALEGDTVTVTLDDSKRDPATLPEGANLNWMVVHQQDVQAVVNALWRGGAKAMMLMDQRVISTSAVRCVGNTLILQGRVYSPPFKITAMGDQAQLRKALKDDPDVANYRDFVDRVGVKYEVENGSNKTFPPFEGTTELRYAKTTKK